MNDPDRFLFNTDWEQRNALLSPYRRCDGQDEESDGCPDIFQFQDAPAALIARLLAARYIAPNDRQNDSPTAAEFYAFMQRHPGVTAHGYAIGIQREDYRVTIEGIAYIGDVSVELSKEVLGLFGRADNCVVESDEIFVWYD